MSRAVLDSSILIAILRREPNAANFARDVSRAIVSSVNAAETMSKLIRLGATDERAWHDVRMLADEIVSFDERQGRLAGELVRATKPFGLSLGDRACLALALTEGLPVYTTDRAWAAVDVGVTIHVVR